MKNKQFFCESIFNIDKNLYLANEAIFYALINPCHKEMKSYGIQEMQFTKTMDECFGDKPNIQNLKKFFANEVI